MLNILFTLALTCILQIYTWVSCDRVLVKIPEAHAPMFTEAVAPAPSLIELISMRGAPELFVSSFENNERLLTASFAIGSVLIFAGLKNSVSSLLPFVVFTRLGELELRGVIGLGLCCCERLLSFAHGHLGL